MTTMTETTKKSTFKTWYDSHKAEFNDQRKQRYNTDAEYRQAALTRAAEARRKLRESREQFEGLSLKDVAENLEISTWTLNDWRNKHYYPEPSRVAGRPSFSVAQLELLGLLKQFFTTYKKRAAALHQEELAKVVGVVFHNWNDAEEQE